MKEIFKSREEFLQEWGGTIVPELCPELWMDLPPRQYIVRSPNVKGLPPNVLHILENGVWKALLPVTNLEYKPIVYAEQLDYIGLRVATPIVRKVEFTIGAVLPEAFFQQVNFTRIKDVLYKCNSETYAISISDAVLQFGARLVDTRELWYTPSKPQLNLELTFVAERNLQRIMQWQK